MTPALFITPAYIKKYGLVDENIDDSYFTPVIQRCQDTFVQEIVGTGLYRELKTQVNAGSVTALNETLLKDYIAPAMLWWVQAKVLKPTTYKFGNSGVKQMENEFYITPSKEVLDNMEEEYMNSAEYYANATTMYLIENNTSYPLYDNPGTGVDVVHPNRNQFKSQIFLGGCRKKGWDGIDVDMGDRYYVCRDKRR